MKKKFLSLVLLTTSLLSLQAQAAAYFKCLGTSEKETLQFLVSEQQTVAIYQASLDLCVGYLSIADDAVFLETLKVLPNNKTNYSTWYGSWGFGLTLPNKLLRTMTSQSKTFHVDYKFKYSDTAEAEVARTLTCSAL